MSDSRVNPLTGKNGRGFKVAKYNPRAEKLACAEILQKALPAGHTLISFRYVAQGTPQDSVTEIRVQKPDTSVDVWRARAPIDPEGRPWGGRIPTVLAAFLKAKYP